MKTTTVETTFRRFASDESGQMIPVLAFMMVALLAMTGFAVDVGRIIYANRQLQAATDAAALAGASNLPSATAIGVANLYSAQAGDLNYHTTMPGVTMVPGYPKVLCLNTLNDQGMSCQAPANGNALAVKQQVTLNLTFLKVIGITQYTIGASATASMRGSTAAPYNVAIVVDTTPSMNTYDSDTNCSTTRLNCAMAGVRTLLQSLSPCASNLTTCGAATNGNVANAVDKVALYTFPGLTSTTQAQYDYDCSSRAPSVSPYSYPTLPVYQVVNFSSDYRSSNTASSLSPTSNLSIAAGGKSSCIGLQAVPNNYDTYFASSIYAAQADLLAQSAVNGNQNVLIFLSDGDSNAPSTSFRGSFSTVLSSLIGYPSIYYQCKQAVTAANIAKAAGTKIYSVAYGAGGGGCSKDYGSITACQTMQQIATSNDYFYSDATSSQNAGQCYSSAHSVTGLNQIFTQIAGNLTVGRLIPDNTP
jgi:Flp pilus assembly protein TadG